MIGRIFVGTFLMGIMWSMFDVNPIVTGLIIGVLYGLTDLAKEQGRIK
jgi:hypothetical protein|tara:strand:+ start:620 stop:763 length:144 start_codon:yes stop_codon:yes gene_type:complete